MTNRLWAFPVIWFFSFSIIYIFSDKGLISYEKIKLKENKVKTNKIFYKQEDRLKKEKRVVRNGRNKIKKNKRLIIKGIKSNESYNSYLTRMKKANAISDKFVLSIEENYPTREINGENFIYIGDSYKHIPELNKFKGLGGQAVFNKKTRNFSILINEITINADERFDINDILADYPDAILKYSDFQTGSYVVAFSNNIDCIDINKDINEFTGVKRSHLTLFDDFIRPK